MRSRDHLHLSSWAAVISAVALGAAALNAVAAAAASATTAGGFRTTYALATARSHATATRLEDGDVLVAGGQGPSGAALSSAEIYRNSTGSWSPTPPMPVGVTQATATLLSNGDVLVAGGLTGAGGALVPTAASQLYDPATDRWSLTKGQLLQASFGAVAARLGSGEVLYAGGLPSTSQSAVATVTSELFDPSTGQWSQTASMPVGVAGAQVATLPGGDVLVAGGEKGPSAGVTDVTQVFQPSGLKWATSTHMPIAVADAASAVLQGGDVLVAGGKTTSNGTPTNVTQVFDPTSVTWRTGGALPQASYGAMAALLSSGQVLYAGGMTGTNDSTPTAASELFNLSTGQWAPTGRLVVAEGFGAATSLPGGNVLVAGGLAAGGPTAVVQVYEPNLAASAPAITSNSVFEIKAGRSNNVTVTTTGAPTPHLTESGVLPPGMAFRDNGNGTASISGTVPANVTGVYRVTITASNGVGNPAVQQLSLVVTSTQSAPKITSKPVLQVPAGRYDAFEVTATGSPTPQLTESGVLPPGMAFRDNGNGTASISGTVPANVRGVYRVTITASNGVGNPAVQQLSLVVAGVAAAPKITSPSTFNVLAGRFNNFTVTTNGLPTPTITEFGALPPGMVFHYNGNGTASISGTPPANISGTYRVTLVASNSVGTPSVKQLSLVVTNVLRAPSITTASEFHAVAGRPNSFIIKASGSPAPSLTESGALPPGMVFHDNGNGSATVSGTPFAGTTGTYNVTVVASNGVGPAAVQRVSFTFGTPAAITSSSNVTVQTGRYNVFTVTASGSPTPTLTKSGALPPGLTFQYQGNGTAKIFGTVPANARGTYRATVTASNGVGNAAVQHLVFHLVPPPQPSVIVSSPRFLLESGRHNVVTLRASGSPVPRIAEAGALPPGMSFHANTDGTATISGTIPAYARGTYRVTLTAANGVGSPSVQTLQLMVGTSVQSATSYGAGYWYTTAEGTVLGQGSAVPMAASTPQHPHNVVSMAATPDGDGYYLASSSGGVFNFGAAHWYGSLHGRHLGTPTVAIAVTPSGGGYYLATARGNVFNFGVAHWYGSTAGHHLAPIASMALTPNGRGYWLVSIYGNIYAFGNARFYGSPANRPVPRVVALEPTPNGQGYWVVTSHGNVFAYGNAPFYGSSAMGHLLSKVTSFAVDR